MYFDLRCFVNLTSKAKEVKAKINKKDCIKLKRLCTTKETINNTKSQPTKWEKIFANDPSSKGDISYPKMGKGSKQTLFSDSF